MLEKEIASKDAEIFELTRKMEAYTRKLEELRKEHVQTMTNLDAQTVFS